MSIGDTDLKCISVQLEKELRKAGEDPKKKLKLLDSLYIRKKETKTGGKEFVIERKHIWTPLVNKIFRRQSEYDAKKIFEEIQGMVKKVKTINAEAVTVVRNLNNIIAHINSKRSADRRITELHFDKPTLSASIPEEKPSTQSPTPVVMDENPLNEEEKILTELNDEESSIETDNENSYTPLGEVNFESEDDEPIEKISEEPDMPQASQEEKQLTVTERRKQLERELGGILNLQGVLAKRGESGKITKMEIESLASAAFGKAEAIEIALLANKMNKAIDTLTDKLDKLEQRTWQEFFGIKANPFAEKSGTLQRAAYILVYNKLLDSKEKIDNEGDKLELSDCKATLIRIIQAKSMLQEFDADLSKNIEDNIQYKALYLLFAEAICSEDSVKNNGSSNNELVKIYATSPVTMNKTEFEISHKTIKEIASKIKMQNTEMLEQNFDLIR